MKYNGIELKEFTNDKPVVFDPPKKMLVWDKETDTPAVRDIHAVIRRQHSALSVIGSVTVYRHCAEIPEESEPRRATNKELSKWLAQGNGLCTHCSGSSVWPYLDMNIDALDVECDLGYLVRKWDDKEWHEPTADYMGLED